MQSTPFKEDVLSVLEAAAFLKTSSTMVLRLLEAERLPGLELTPGNWRLSRKSLLNLLDETSPLPISVDGASPEKPEVKIGILVRQKFKEMLGEGTLPGDVIHLLEDATYCKKTFGVNFPVLLSIIQGRDLAEQRRVGKHSRYWNQVFPGNYLVTSEWYEGQRQQFLVWVKHY